MIKGVLNLLFPPKCPFCHCLLEESSDLFCSRCQRELPWAGTVGGQKNVEFLSGCLSPLYYRGEVRDGVHRYKFENRPGYADAFGLLMAQAVQDAWPEVAFDCVTWVPLSHRRKRKRGYDQAQLLAQSVSKRLGLPCRSTLVKIRHTPAQSRQADPGARRVNVLGAYKADGNDSLTGLRILLCDDVVTTGATLSQCAQTLRWAGAAEVYAVTLARIPN